LLIQRASEIAEESTRLAIGSDVSYIQSWTAIIEDVEKGILDRSLMGKMKSNQMVN